MLNTPSNAATSSCGMVTSPHVLASQAGQDVLAAGGKAIEAAITIATCLGVTYRSTRVATESRAVASGMHEI